MTNKIFAGISFVFSLIIYIATMAPTTSFWDCGEFIACSHTLGVPHPPGTPLYLLIGNVFSNLLFFVGDIGARVNLISPIVSAFSVMFLYLIIIELIAWHKDRNDKISSLSTYSSALIGSLLFAFTDSQWFNAVEAEVYGMSTFFTAIVVWLALKWSNNRQQNGNVRYIILISYLMGLATGLHLLNLLAIPFIALVLYFNITKDQLGGFLLDNIIFYTLALISFAGFDILGFKLIGNIFLTSIIISLAIAIKYLILYLMYEENLIDYLKLYAKRISVLLISGFIFLIINSGIIKGIPNMLNFFSSENASFIMNFFFPLVLIISLIAGFGLFFYIKNKIFRVSIISLLMIYIGFSTYILIPIRAIDNPNINENSPDSWENFLSYMNRDQYGNWKNIDWFNILKYYLSSETIGSSEFGKLNTNEIFWLTKKNDAPWKKVNQFQGLNINSKELRDFDLSKKIFRKFQFEKSSFSELKDGQEFWTTSSNDNKIYFDKSNHWIKEIPKKKFPDCEIEKNEPIGRNQMRQSIDRKFNLNTTVYQKINIDASRLLESPNIKRWGSIQTFLSDSEQSPNKNILNFIWNYQVKEMYLRYFAWQFAGKEYYKENFSWHRDEASDRGEAIPEPLSNINWYHYGIPFSLIFGLIGMVYHFIKDSRKAFSILVLFLVTGIAIILYLNQYDPQPRERDYSYVGSFFAFSIWIGIGCMALFDFAIYVFNLLKSKSTDKNLILIPIIIVSSLLFGIMPLNHLISDYHYHDRKGNYAAQDYGYNLLNSCNPYSILFTNGDNDTFPLWYAQEIDKVRPDVRVINLSLLNTPWYINQIYNNNAPGNIKFNFDEPIISQNQYDQIYNPESLNLPIFKYKEGYYIDLNNNNKYDTYNEQQTLNIIKNLEDPVTGTIYAYKRWDPVAWASIEKNYFKLEIMQSFDNLNDYNILRFIYQSDYDSNLNQIDLKAKNTIHPNFDEIIDTYIENGNPEYQTLLLEYNFILTNLHLDYIKELATKNNKRISDYLSEYINKGYGIYNSSECDQKQTIIWGKTPDKVGENYLFPISEYANRPFNPLLFFRDTLIDINQKSTLQNYFFRIQDIMILKIIEDLNHERDIYFATTVNPESQMSLNQYLLNQGMVLKLSDQKLISNINDPYLVDREKLKENLFEKYRFTNLNNHNVYYNSDLQRILQNYRMLFLYLADEYSNPENIKEIMTHMNVVMPTDVIKIQRTGLQIYTAEKYLNAGMIDDYKKIINDITKDNNIIKNLELAEYLSQVEDFKTSNALIKKSLSVYPDYSNQQLEECLLTIDAQINEKINAITDITTKEIEDIVYTTITKNLIQYNINYYENDIIIRALQILTRNYIKIYE